MNKAILIGTLGKDPEIRDVNGKKIATMSLATTRRWRDKSGEKKEETQWHRVIAWEKVAGIFESYTKKGSKVCVIGEIQNREYTDKDGVKKHISEVRVEEMELLSPATGQGQGTSTQQRTSSPSQPSNDNYDLPF